MPGTINKIKNYTEKISMIFAKDDMHKLKNDLKFLLLFHEI